MTTQTVVREYLPRPVTTTDRNGYRTLEYSDPVKAGDAIFILTRQFSRDVEVQSRYAADGTSRHFVVFALQEGDLHGFSMLDPIGEEGVWFPAPPVDENGEDFPF